jgi:hypothetical protein
MNYIRLHIFMMRDFFGIGGESLPQQTLLATFFHCYVPQEIPKWGQRDVFHYLPLMYQIDSKW